MSTSAPQSLELPASPIRDAADADTVRLHVSGMHCAACAATVTQTLNAQSGVSEATVDAVTGIAQFRVTHAHASDATVWQQAIAKAGFQLDVPVRVSATRGAQSRSDAPISSVTREHRTMLWRWLVAGFCMMQVMMYTTPQYFANDISEAEAQMLNWAAWALTLPVLIFSCKPFFKGAWAGIRSGTVSMDLPVAASIVIVFALGTLVTLLPNGWWGRDTYFDSLTMFVFFLLSGRWLESRLRVRVASSLTGIARMLPNTATRKFASGATELIEREALQVGDVVIVRAGEAFPADGIIVGSDTWADESLVSGESKPIFRARGDEVLAGSYNQSRVTEVRITRAHADTRYAQMIALVESAASQKPRLVMLADRIAKPFILLVCAIALGVFLYSVNDDPAKALLHAATVLIVTCPCALALAAPTALLASAGALAREGVLVRRIEALETIAGVDRLLFDKTGTLTDDQIRLQGAQYAQDFDRSEARAIAFALASQSLHPISKALAASLKEAGVDEIISARVSEFEEIPGAGLRGAYFDVHGQRVEVRLGSRAHIGIGRAHADTSANAAQSLSTHLAINGEPAAEFVFAEGIREGADAVSAALEKLDVAAEIVSGDRQAAVTRVASALGIAVAQAECTPEQKLARLAQAQASGERVAMVGDGLNDGPVLARADVAIAMGHAVPISQNKADFIIVRDEIAVLPQLIAHARKTQHVIAQNLIWAAVYNITCIPLAIVGWLPPWAAGLGMVASSLLVTSNALRLARVSKDSASPWKSSPSSSHCQLPSCC